jgi:hypothetical protein
MPGEKEREPKAVQAYTRSSPRHDAAKTRAVDGVAEWMAAQVRNRGKLDHHEAANAIRDGRPIEVMLWKLIVGAQERNDRDGSIREVYRFSPPVLEKFRMLTGNAVRWGKKDRYWVAVKPKARNG